MKNEDIKIQDSMIRFSMFLSKNIRKQKQCEARIKDEDNKIKEKQEEKVIKDRLLEQL